ncbi:MAG TPA: potassium-transporting ATPase subunit KdpC [Ktedonobacteraceae bacterium]|jgi:K+-transporting ATPase ATPase C chain|nr:potassium-transporting ATPase subunit KdpC [Ktedonobacteraceae bacterium]
MKTFLIKYLRPAVALAIILTIVTGFLYPGVVTVLAQVLFNHQANGSLLCNAQGQVVGSELIGQYWTQLKYFHGRPSATVNPVTEKPEPYAADNSSASNLGPTNAALKQDVQQRIAALQAEFKQEHLPVPAGSVPVDLVTASGSGLDPDISIAAAMYQVPVVAAARGMSQQAVMNLITSNETGRFLGVFGEPYVNVLTLNLALDGPSANVHQC